MKRISSGKLSRRSFASERRARCAVRCCVGEREGMSTWTLITEPQFKPSSTHSSTADSLRLWNWFFHFVCLLASWEVFHIFNYYVELPAWSKPSSKPLFVLFACGISLSALQASLNLHQHYFWRPEQAHMTGVEQKSVTRHNNSSRRKNRSFWEKERKTNFG